MYSNTVFSGVGVGFYCTENLYIVMDISHSNNTIILQSATCFG
jgi:hypothetical protein